MLINEISFWIVFYKILYLNDIINIGWPLKDWMILNKNDFYKHVFFKFFIILFGNMINGFFSVLCVKNNIPQMLQILI